MYQVMSTVDSTDVFDIIPGDSRETTIPIARPELYGYVEDARDAFWTHKEINISADKKHYSTKLSGGEQNLIKYILAFFASADGLVNVNLAERFKKDVPMLDARYFYNIQEAVEDVHAHTYSMLIEEIIPSQEERDELFSAAKKIPAVKKMNDYIHECVNSKAPLGERILRMACVEGIFFTGCFCVIYWFQQRGLMPGLAQSNELIAKDESLHTYFAMFLYTMIVPAHKISRKRVEEIFREAVDIAIEFTCAALPTGLPGMTAALMTDYIKCQADNLVTLIDMEPIYGSEHIFHFMDQINLVNRINFFERRATEYSKVHTADTGYGISTDF